LVNRALTVWLKMHKNKGRDFMLEDVREIYFKVNGDDRGKLVVVEGLKDLPFEIARIFYIFGFGADVVRGCHANRRSEFVLINICGASKVKVMDGKNEKIYVLNEPYKGIYLPKMVWKEMYDFSKDSVLLTLASEPYDAAEYIRDYQEYIREVWGNE